MCGKEGKQGVPIPSAAEVRFATTIKLKAQSVEEIDAFLDSLKQALANLSEVNMLASNFFTFFDVTIIVEASGAGERQD